MNASASPPAGWYPDVAGGTLRYWDGTRWTGQSTPIPPHPAAAPSVVVNVGLPAVSDSAEVAQIRALADPQTAQALTNLENLRRAQVITNAEFQSAKDKLLGHGAAQPAPLPPALPAGWYDDGAGGRRWWDGQSWVEAHPETAIAPVAPTAATPPGWYDDGAGHQRWWDGQRWSLQRSSSHLWWALSPLYTCGAISFIPALHAAIKLKRRSLWYWAGGLIAGNAIVYLLVRGPTDPEVPNTPLQQAGATLAVVVAVLGVIQAFRTRDEVFARTPAAVPGKPAIELDPAIQASVAARNRRAESLALSVKDPGLARDLMIGRPDLTREYDDGGLVDVNHVPAQILVTHLGLSPEEAQAVIEAREYVGGFRSANDLCQVVNLPQRKLDEVRDHVVTL